MTQSNLAKALALKNRGMALAATGNDGFLAAMRAYAKARSQQHGFVTADDVRAYAEAIGLQPSSPKVWGSTFRGSGWSRVGYHQSGIVANHGHYYPVWKWVGG